MTSAAPAFVLQSVVKAYGAPHPLRVSRLAFAVGQRAVLSGLDALGAEMFVHVLTGAALPDAGTVEVFGQRTDAIATDTAWLASLDRFGLVSNRAVLLDQSTIAQNLALPMTLSIDPMPDDVRATVEQMARDVDLAVDRLDQLAGTMTPSERMRAHLARALATTPDVLLLEHPTLTLGGDAAAFGETLQRLSAHRPMGWLALSDDETFARATGAERWRVNTATGDVRADGAWWRRWIR